MKVKIVEIGNADAWWSNTELIGMIGEFSPDEGSIRTGEWSSGTFNPDDISEEEYYFRLVKVEEVTVTSPSKKRKFKITLEVQVEEMTEEEA